jgi:hypothetical protein
MLVLRFRVSNFYLPVDGGLITYYNKAKRDQLTDNIFIKEVIHGLFNLLFLLPNKQSYGVWKFLETNNCVIYGSLSHATGFMGCKSKAAVLTNTFSVHLHFTVARVKSKNRDRTVIATLQPVFRIICNLPKLSPEVELHVQIV